jgi:hypothetical protein
VLRRCLLAAAIWLVVLAVPAIAANQPLQKVLLRPGQVGAGYQLLRFKQGNVVAGQVTLDLCGLSFPSERLRLARRQVAYLHHGKVVQLSNEVVRYKRGGAQQALRELRSAAARCPRGPVSGPVRGVGPITYRLTRFTNGRLLREHLALLVHGVGKIDGRHVDTTVLHVFQVRGDVLSGIYTDGTGGIRVQRRVGLHAAAESAKNLERFTPR